jgi:hypothetical protein
MSTARGLFAVSLLIALVAGCSGSSSGQNPIGPGRTDLAATSGGRSLASGLANNLDSLTSYRFTASTSGSTAGGQAAPSSAATAATFLITGTVINKPLRALWITASGAQFILVGSQAWTSFDNTTWTVIDPNAAGLAEFLPTNNYPTWFDANAPDFKALGDESKNGVPCVHYKGSGSLLSLYGATGSPSAGLQDDLWIAKDGNYPVSGAYGLPGYFGYSFDVTNVNDASNIVTPPTDVIALPT